MGLLAAFGALRKVYSELPFDGGPCFEAPPCDAPNDKCGTIKSRDPRVVPRRKRWKQLHGPDAYYRRF